MNKSLSSFSFLLLSGFAGAQTFGFSDIVNWTGTGTNRAAFVLDWNDGTVTRSMAWGFRWTGSATAEQMLRDVDANDPRLTLGFTLYSGFGYALTAASYDLNLDGTPEHDRDGFALGTTGYWAFYNGGPSSTLPSWTSSNFGITSVALVTDDWEGLSWAPDFNAVNPATPVAAPVPEPATLAMVGLGVLVLRRRTRG